MNIAWEPLWLSLRVSSLATLLVALLGIPLAWLLARRRFAGKELLNALTTLPLVMPPTVLGYYLLVALGAQSPLGQWLERIGLPAVFTWRGAVIAAAIASFPLMVTSARAGFEAVDERLEGVARTLGRSDFYIFIRVTLPLAWPALLAGTVLAFARALGDFGATLMVAGNIPGRTQTVSIYIYDLLQANRRAETNQMVLIVTAIAVLLLVVAQWLARRK
ncbi:MAG: molybdate ABC transporter permease subunit [Anaerolineales bacterium]|nr:molybdate ABC transporter permease subunit [Anaerolineales bacterium]MCB9129245.1 molybdate ABC transporter permease subunit [Ardenticatenales bacterium]